MLKQLGLLGAKTVAPTVVGVRPSPPPQRVESPQSTDPAGEITPVAKPMKDKGRTAHFHMESVATKLKGDTYREIYDYTVLPLSPDAHMPTEPCPCRSRRFQTYYWVADRDRYYDNQGRLKPPTTTIGLALVVPPRSPAVG